MAAVDGPAAVLALLAAGLFAVGAVAQHRSAVAVTDDRGRGPRLLLVLVRRPLWWAGLVSDTGGYAAQAAALGLGSLLLVQPLLVTTLLFALPLSARWGGRRLGRSDWAWAAVLAVALAAFLVVGRPSAGLDRAGLRQWLAPLVVLGLLLGLTLVGAALSHGTIRALLLAAATATAYAPTAALTKSVVSLLGGGMTAVLASWETYVLVACIIGGFLLQQSAYQAGALQASLPAMTVGEPVATVAIGVAVLGEQLAVHGATWVLIGLLVVAMGTATAALARSVSRLDAAALYGS